MKYDLYFGHYKYVALSPYLNQFHVAKAMVALTTGIPYPCWQHGITVMLEKELGVNLVFKFQAILLMEADFNVANKLMFSYHMLTNIQHHQSMPEEIISKRSKTPVDGTVSKILFYDISCKL